MIWYIICILLYVLIDNLPFTIAVKKKYKTPM